MQSGYRRKQGLQDVKSLEAKVVSFTLRCSEKQASSTAKLFLNKAERLHVLHARNIWCFWIDFSNRIFWNVCASLEKEGEKLLREADMEAEKISFSAWHAWVYLNWTLFCCTDLKPQTTCRWLRKRNSQKPIHRVRYSPFSQVVEVEQSSPEQLAVLCVHNNIIHDNWNCKLENKRQQIHCQTVKHWHGDSKVRLLSRNKLSGKRSPKCYAFCDLPASRNLFPSRPRRRIFTTFIACKQLSSEGPYSTITYINWHQ